MHRRRESEIGATFGSFGGDFVFLDIDPHRSHTLRQNIEGATFLLTFARNPLGEKAVEPSFFWVELAARSARATVSIFVITIVTAQVFMGILCTIMIFKVIILHSLILALATHLEHALQEVANGLVSPRGISDVARIQKRVRIQLINTWQVGERIGS